MGPPRPAGIGKDNGPSAKAVFRNREILSGNCFPQKSYPADRLRISFAGPLDQSPDAGIFIGIFDRLPTDPLEELEKAVSNRKID